MPRRKTIGRNPLAERAKPPPKAEEPPPPPEPEQATAPPARRQAQARDAVGGRIELLGGDLGRATVRVGLFGEQRTLGFFPHEHEFVDLEDQVASIAAWPDITDYRLIEAIGWGWTCAILGGAAFAILGGGLRLLHPPRMMFEMHLRDGRQCVGRTDKVTIAALEAIARGHAAADSRHPSPASHSRSPGGL